MTTRQKWYMEKVPERRNREWSDTDKLEVYTMMTKNFPAAEIAQKFKVSLIQIYNIVRLVRKGIKNECYMCGESLSGEEAKENTGKLIKACKKCKDRSQLYKEDLRKKAARVHKCIYCLTRPVILGHKSCPHCISATHRRRYAKGLCGQCGKNPIGKNKLALCDGCAEKIRVRVAFHRQRKKTI